jgi:ABC-type uncharacterized transport system involved in gliding motility auxiliary subunit
MTNQRSFTFIALVLAAIIFVGINIFSANLLTAERLDLTENGSYTISDGTRAIIAKLPEPVTLKFYYSRNTAAEYAATVAYAKRVRDLLGQYASLSHGKIILQDIDPEPFTPEEDEAGAAGLQPAPTQSGDVVYFGLAASNRVDGKETISYFAPDREPYLEYDLSAMLYRLSHPQKPVLGLLSSLMPAQDQRTPAILTAIRENYQVTPLGADFTQLPANLDLLMIVHPPSLNPAQLAAIDGFVKRGGRALVFVDPMSEIAQQSNSPPFSDLEPLLQQWGIAYAPDRVVLDRQLAQRVAAGNDPRTPSLAYPLWLHLTAANFDHTDPITANLQSLNVASAGALFPAKGATRKFEPLLQSSDQAALVPRDAVAARNDPDQLMALAVSSGQRFTLAARVTGLNVVVVADTDLLDDRFWVHMTDSLSGQVPEPFADNGGLVLNAVENLTGSGDLIALRTRTNTDRPFTVVRAMQTEAEGKFRETAQTLQRRLTAAQQQVQQLQQGGSGGGAVSLTPKQQADLSRIRQEMAQTRAELRDVQHNLRADIDALGSELAFINIVLMPLIVAAFAIVLGMMRRGRRRA